MRERKREGKRERMGMSERERESMKERVRVCETGVARQVEDVKPDHLVQECLCV